jgi:hypothetical protein
MAQTRAERKSAQRALARNLSQGRHTFPATLTGKTHAASVLGYTKAEWATFSSQQKEELRNEVRNAEKRIERFTNKPADKRKGEFAPDDWQTWEWELYREAMGM